VNPSNLEDRLARGEVVRSSDCRVPNVALQDVKVYAQELAEEFQSCTSACIDERTDERYAEKLYACITGKEERANVVQPEEEEEAPFFAGFSSDVPRERELDEDFDNSRCVQDAFENIDGTWLTLDSGEPIAVIRGLDIRLLGDGADLKPVLHPEGNGIWTIIIDDEDFLGDCREEDGRLTLHWSDGETWVRQAEEAAEPRVTKRKKRKQDESSDESDASNSSTSSSTKSSITSDSSSSSSSSSFTSFAFESDIDEIESVQPETKGLLTSASRSTKVA